MKKYRSVGQFILFGFILALFIAVIHSFILPVVLGLLISLVFRPVYSGLARRFSNRNHLAAALSTFLLTLCVIVPLVITGFFLIRDIGNLVQSINRISAADGQGLMKTPLGIGLFKIVTKFYPVAPAEFENLLRTWLTSAAGEGRHFIAGIAATIPRKMLFLVFFLITFYFGLVDGPKFIDFLRLNLPFSASEESELFTAIHKTTKAVVTGALMVGLVQGTLMGLAYWILGIPRPFVFAVITAICSFIPLVGCAPTGIGGVIFLLANGRSGAAVAMLLFFALVSVSDNVVRPWVLKGKTQLHPLLGLLSVLGGMRLFGISGLFLGPVITASAIVLIQLIHHRMKILRKEAPDPRTLADT